MGGDPQALAEAQGIETSAPTVPLRGFVGLMQAAAAAVGSPGLGRAAGSAFALANLGEMGLAMEAAPSLGAAFSIFCRAFAAVQSDSQLELAVEDGAASLRYRILDPRVWPRDQDAEFTMTILAGFIGRVAGRGWRPLRVALEHAPRESEAEREAAWRCPVRHGAVWNVLEFPAQLLDRPTPDPAPDEFRRIARDVAARAAERRQEAGLALRARREVLARLGEGEVTQGAVATALGRSERSMRRQLLAEGASFSELLAACRCEIGRVMLAQGSLTTAEIAARLGYSDATAFERAFRRRTGLTIAAARRG